MTTQRQDRLCQQAAQTPPADSRRRTDSLTHLPTESSAPDDLTKWGRPRLELVKQRLYSIESPTPEQEAQLDAVLDELARRRHSISASDIALASPRELWALERRLNDIGNNPESSLGELLFADAGIKTLRAEFSKRALLSYFEGQP